jgi:hypothetical protein
MLGRKPLHAIDVTLRIDHEGGATVMHDVTAITEPAGVECEDVRDSGCRHGRSLLVVCTRDYTPGGT